MAVYRNNVTMTGDERGLALLYYVAQWNVYDIWAYDARYDFSYTSPQITRYCHSQLVFRRLLLLFSEWHFSTSNKLSQIVG